MRSAVLLFFLNIAVSYAAPVTNESFVGVDVFYRSGCPECRQVREEILPAIELRYGELAPIRMLNVEQPLYGAVLGELLRKHEGKEAPVHMVIAGKELFSGLDEIEAEVFSAIDEALASGESGAVVLEQNAAASFLTEEKSFPVLLLVFFAGLADAVNPCAISTLVFLVSVLITLKLPRLRVVGIGLVFCAGVYVTYFTAGFGLLHGMRMLLDAWNVSRWFDLILLVVVLILGVISLYDAVCYLQTGNSSSVILRMPEGLKRGVNKVVRLWKRGGAGIVTAFIMGAAVALLEGICTGQVYVPALALIVRRGGAGSLRSLALLAVYNFAFILPLLGILFVSLFVTSLDAWITFGRREVFAGKILLAVFFFLLAGLMLVGFN